METERNMQIHQRQIAGLDSLRGIAVIGVVLYHMFPDVIKGGFLGVSLFFALSGYLLAVTSKTAWENQKFDVLGFYKKRILRIYPALLMTVFGTVILLNRFVPPAMDGIHSEIFSIFGGYNNWWQISQNASYFTRVDGMSPFTHLWSLAIELQYYLIWPLLFRICMKLNHRKGDRAAGWFMLVLAVLSLFAMSFVYRPGEDPSRAYYGTDTRIFALLAGSVLGFSQKDKRERPVKGERKYRILLTVSFLLLAVLFVTADGQDSLTYQLTLPFVSLLLLVLIYLVSVPELPFGRWLDATPLRWIGTYSYEIYLCQYPLNFLFQLWKRGRNPYIMIILELAAVIGVSLWLHYFSAIFKRKKGAVELSAAE